MKNSILHKNVITVRTKNTKSCTTVTLQLCRYCLWSLPIKLSPSSLHYTVCTNLHREEHYKMKGVVLSVHLTVTCLDLT